MGRFRVFLLLSWLVGCVFITAETLSANPKCAPKCCHHDADFVLFESKPDCAIMIADIEIRAHRDVLAASIPYFKDSFRNNSSEMIRVELSADLDLSAIKCLVNFAYKKTVRIASHNVESLLRAARFLRISNVVDECTKFMVARFTPETIIGTLNMDNLSQFPALRSKAEEYAHRHFYNLSQTESILDLNIEAFLNLIDSSDLNLSVEQPVFEVAIRWLEHKPEVRSEMTWDILKHVRYPLLPLSYLTTRVQTENLVRSSSSVQQLIDEAIQYSPNQHTTLEGCRAWPRNGTAHFIVLGIMDRNTHFINLTDIPNQRVIEAELPMFFGAAVYECQIYTFGGGSVDDQKSFSLVYQYHPKRNTWVPVSSMNVARMFPAAATMKNRIYVSGGFNENGTVNTVESYNPDTKTWSIVAPLLQSRVNHQLIVFKNTLYAIGGFEDFQRSIEALKSVERFDVVRNEWTWETPMLIGRVLMGVAELNGKLYACGGTEFSMEALQTAEVFDPVTRQWKLIASLSVPRAFVTLLVHKSKLYAFGGGDRSGALKSVDVYDPEKHSWELIEDNLAHANVSITVMLDGYVGIVQFITQQREMKATSTHYMIADSMFF